MNDHSDIRQLFDKFVRNTCTPEEAAQVMRMLRSGRNRVDIEQLIEAHMQDSMDAPADEMTIRRVFERLDLGSHPTRKRPKYIRFSLAAAMLLVAIATGIHLYFPRQEIVPVTTQQDVAPGGNRATLTLADGRTIELSSEQSGIVVGDGIAYTDGSAVVENNALNASFLTLNSITTPKGGTYQIVLPDGTNVWLNSASTLEYPSQFDKNQRVVALEGEAYFEVKEQKYRHASTPHRATGEKGSQKIPFKVKSGDQTVEVIGTHFNINAYPDESTTNTTLLEGLVRIVTPTHSALLKPGQQSKVDHSGLAVASVDTETVIDWKNGDFIFANETLENIMRKIARWYDVEVMYQGQLSKDRFDAQISRNKNLSEVLHILELSGGLTFRISDGVVFLSPSN